jgi:hypothetical protein
MHDKVRSARARTHHSDGSGGKHTCKGFPLVFKSRANRRKDLSGQPSIHNTQQARANAVKVVNTTPTRKDAAHQPAPTTCDTALKRALRTGILSAPSAPCDGHWSVCRGTARKSFPS